jgi:hypothetical protein
MIDQRSHDRLIAKLQHFADYMHQRKLEKEALSITLHRSSLKSDIKNQILIYQEILEEYHLEFKDIIVGDL